MMNYVGNITILDRGDAPAQAIIDRNARSLAQRVADETKDELSKVLERVDNIYDNFEVSSTLYENNKSNLEYVNDLAELEDLIKDQVKKKKYMQQVTIFIVGFENVSGQKLRLLQQVNEFFMANATKLDDDDLMSKSPEIDLEDMAETVEDTLKVTEDLTYRLSAINKEMMEYMYNYAQAKTSNKGKKKMEKSLNQAKEDISSLNEKLHGLQEDIEEKEEKMQQLFKQVEMKSMEVQRYKTAAEVAKRHVEDMSKLREELSNKDEKLKELTQKIGQLELDKGQAEFMQRQANTKLDTANTESVAQVVDLKEALNGKQREMENSRRELKVIHAAEITELKQEHDSTVNQLKSQHMNEVQDLLERVEFMKYKVNTFQAEADLKAAEAEKALLAAESSARQADSRADSAEKHRRLAEDAEAEKQVAQQQAYDAAVHALELQSVQSQTQSFIRSDTEGLNSEDNSTDVSRRPSRQEVKKDKKKSKTSGRANQYKADQEAETAGAEEVESDGEESKKVKTAAGRVGVSRGAPQRGMSGLATLPEGEIAEDIALDDEEAWEAVPMEHVPGRFTQYRAMSRKRIAELDTEIDTTVTKTARKIQTLKAQFHEHRDKWQAEREILLSHMEQAQDLQDKAEKEADQALDHLEDFIVEQEKLEKHEESQRMELMKEEMTLDEKQQQKSAELLAAEEALNKELEEQQQDPQPPPVEPVERDDGGDIADEELDKALLQQTDDAKLEQSSRATSSMSRSSLREHQRSVLSQMKSSVAGRRSATPTAKSAKSFRSSALSDAVLDENGDIPFPDDITAEEREVLSMHDVATSPMSMKTPSAQPRRTSAVRPHSDLSKHLEVTGQFVKDMTQIDAPLDLVAPTPDPQLASLRDDRITEWKGISMSEHPVVQEYLRAYNNVLDFKNRLSQVLMDKEMVSAAQVLGDIEPVPFDKDDVVQPQIEEMNTNLITILEESVALFSSVLSIDRDYNVSSMSVSQSMSRELTQNPERVTSTAPQTADKSPLEVMSRVSHHPGSAKSKLSDTALREMDEKYQIIQNQLQLETMEREKQLQHNTMIIMEMQETINALRQQLTAMEEAQPQVIPDTEPIMFTRLDSERNAKIMKRAVNDRKLDPEHYEDAMSTMDQYISLPAQRLASLVKKYVHHCKMKEIEVNVQKSKSLNDNVFNILDKMETLQNERAVKWADRMDAISMERIRLANMLMSTLDSIEQESGIFLIKPMYSYKPSYPTGDRFKKSSRTNKPPSPSQTSYVHQQAVPHTPQLANTPDQKHKPNALPPIDDQATQTAYNTEDGITGKSNVLGGDTKGTWSMYSSQVAPMSSDLPVNASHINTPRILELDINRMHIGQNHISSRIVNNSLPEDRVVTGPHMSTRSYLTVTRPSGQTVSHNQSRGATAEARSSVPPTTPLRELETPSSGVPGQTGGSRPVTGQGSRAGSITGSRHGSTTPTLPPITADRKSRKSATIELPLPPHSPPGSSMRQSPPLMDTLSQTSQQQQ